MTRRRSVWTSAVTAMPGGLPEGIRDPERFSPAQGSEKRHE